ncbi:MAG: hypothetical protein ACK4YQ_06535 [Phenylobacterium sp.]|uniref:hypothetical protein n=1 Tax=Phenylobacterium sp. TaxID=1871053 RepID=UPI00391A3A1F
MADSALLDRTYRLVSGAVDAGFYLGLHREAMAGAADPVGHYVRSGWREGLDPAPWFSTADYLADHPDIAAAGVNPLAHYLAQGRLEGRGIRRSRQAERFYAEVAGPDAAAWTFTPGKRPRAPGQSAEDEAREERMAAERAAVGPEFNGAYYMALNPDVAAAGADLLDHFLTFGWREGRDPNGEFSVKSYLSRYPDVAASGINPFVHYVTQGRAEGRSPRESLGFRYDVIERLIPIEERLAACDRNTAAVPLDDPARLAAALAAARERLGDVHVTFSHDDPTTHVGGVQLCLRREGEAARKDGRTHLHVFPPAARPMLRWRRSGAVWGVLLDDEPLGAFAPLDVIAAFGDALAGVTPGRRSFAIHNLLGHHVEDVIELLARFGLKAGHLWLHDFASVCAGVHLLRDDVVDCGAPPMDSPACGVCIYGPYRQDHVEAHARLFDNLELTVAAPSQAALDTWRLGPAYPHAGAVVAPHARLVPRPAPAVRRADRRLRFGYLGFPVAHKGWPIFSQLAFRHADDPRYAFVHLGKTSVPGVPCLFRHVAVTLDRPLAMRDVIAAESLDVVMVWSLCRETFSFAAYEAVSAGAAVVTGPDSGNVAAFVEAGGHGLVLRDEAELAAAFESGEILDLARARRGERVYDLEFSALTFDLLRGGA